MQEEVSQKTYDKTSVKKLAGKGIEVLPIKVTNGNIKSFERVSSKYNVDFVVKKDKTTDMQK